LTVDDAPCFGRTSVFVVALSHEEAKKQRRELMRDIAREHKRKDREKLAALRTQIRNVKTRRKDALRLVRERCRAGRVVAKQRAKERARAIREEAKNLIKNARDEEKNKARAACKLRKEKVRAAALTARERRRGELAAERALQAEMKRVEGWSRKRKKEQQRTTAAELREESDDAVRSNLSSDLLPLFEKVKRSIKGSTRQSRTEEFLRWAEEHPNEVIDAQEELSRREIARLIREEAALHRATRQPRRYKPSAAELSAIPF
jgi:hypothetical protein